jgi:LDH2 family malate/lactate/ureidoglycolate dehydrogenase
MAIDRGKAERTYGQWWESPDDLVDAPIEALRAVVLGCLERVGCGPADAEFIYSSLLAKALQNDPVRGFGHFPNLIRGARDGTINLRPDIRHLRETPSTALVDGGPGANNVVVCRYAMQLAMDKARANGTAWVSVRSWPVAFAGLLKMAAEAGLVVIALDASIPTVAPWGGTTPMLGNAPTGIGIPAGKHAPIIVDMSITNTSSTPVALAAQWQNVSLPEDFILDEKGQPTNDARDYVPEGWTLGGSGSGYNVRGSLLPLGGALSGHKGYALLFAINVLATALSDTDYPWAKVENGREVQFGCQFVVVDPSAFMPIERFKQHVDEFIEQTKAAPKKSGVAEVLYPGERSQQLQREGLARGTAKLPVSHYRALTDLAAELGLDETLPPPGRA